MSEPITRADLAALFKYLKEGAFSREMTSLGIVVCNYLEPFDRPAESAPPPRVPGPSAHPGRVGVESGSGQPIKPPGLRERIGPPTGDDIAEANAEIRRLRARSDTRRIIEEAPANYYKQGFRAGIEAATEAVDKLRRDPLMRPWPPVADHALCSAVAVIRALTDNSAPDALLPGLEYIAKKIVEHRYAFRSDVSVAEAHKAAGIEYSTLVHREIAARKGG